MSLDRKNKEPAVTKFRIDRISAVEAQLNRAIRCFFEYDDLVCAITLAGAAERVISDMQPSEGLMGVDAYSMRSVINLYIKEEHHAEAARLLRKPYDFFRHADRDHSDAFECEKLVIEFYIAIAIYGFGYVAKRYTNEMKVYLCWTYLQRPQWLNPDTEIRLAAEEHNEFAKNLSKNAYFQLCFEHLTAQPRKSCG